MSNFKQSLVETNGIELHITEEGEGPLVLFCHGFPKNIVFVASSDSRAR